MNKRSVYVKHPSLKEKAKEKWTGFKRKAEAGIVKAAEWARDNWEVISVVGVPTLMLVGRGVKSLHRNHERHQQQMLKDRYIYDRSTGHYWKLNRTPRQSDWLELERRRQDSTLGEALRDMRLI